MFETITFETTQNIGQIVINRPEALNALNGEVLDDLDRFLEGFIQKPSAGCLIITGSGDKAFVAGADIKEIDSFGREGAARFSQKGTKLFRRFEKLRIPIIAAVNGFALGGGLELALACDFIYASENARFGLPEVSLGIMPGFGGTQRLARLVGLNRAREMIFSAQMVTASEAYQMGLVNKVVAPEKLLEEVNKVASKICAQGPLGILTAKRSINEGFDMPIDEGMRLENELFAELFGTGDQKEGTQAFMEKRKPRFQGD